MLLHVLLKSLKYAAQLPKRSLNYASFEKKAKKISFSFSPDKLKYTKAMHVHFDDT